jgi:peroxiredoxin
MNRPHAHGPQVEPSLIPQEGWHCTHIYYSLDRVRLSRLESDARSRGREELQQILDPEGENAPVQMQSFVVSGHKADFGLMLLDPDPLRIDAVHQAIMSSGLGTCLQPSYSFVSLTEVSEYVPTLQQYADRLVDEGEEAGSPSYEAKVNAYKTREPAMRKQRLTPDLVSWPAMCFYPMNKKRQTGENWFREPLVHRRRMMAEHAKSGMEFAGRVTQLITVGVGLDDWEWGVTLWAKNPEFLKDIVYRMRFDEASARYAEFGPFYVGYLAAAAEILDHCRVS